ncbi:MAG: DUF4062 domain-containing protein [Desulfobaccales bacterium]
MLARVFVSSVMEGFREFRQAAKKGIIAAGAQPILIEDFPALAVSPRNACLDGVESSDIFIAIIGKRGGWTAPSGKLVVEEEYEEALRRRLRILAFIHDVERDDEAQRFVTILSDYVGGVLRPTFRTPAELENAVEHALKTYIPHYKHSKVELSMIQENLKKCQEFNLHDETFLRFILVPERMGEVIDPVFIGSQEFIEQLYTIGHSAQVRLFSYEHPKAPEMRVNEVIILQPYQNRSRDSLDEVRLEIAVSGTIIIDANVTGRIPRRPDNMDTSFYIYNEDIEAILKKCFSFSNGFYATKDPYQRYDRLLYNISLCGIGYRSLVTQAPPGHTYSLANRIDDVVAAFDKPRLITMAELRSPEKEIERVITLFSRRLKRE